jgi:hypothetical protein
MACLEPGNFIRIVEARRHIIGNSSISQKNTRIEKFPCIPNKPSLNSFSIKMPQDINHTFGNILFERVLVTAIMHVYCNENTK